MPDPGSKLCTYKILTKVGEGSHSEVFHAQDERLGRQVALRVLSQAASRDSKVIERFRKAAQRLAALNHGGILPILQIDEAAGRMFCAMPFLTNGNLRDMCGRGLQRSQLLHIACGVAEALAFAHKQGLLHRELKPENILINDQGDALVADFGLARALRRDPDASATSVMESDPRYTSPEEARGQELDSRTDIYSLGVILHEAMSGKAPFDGKEPMAVMFKHVTDPIPPLPKAYRDLEPLIQRLMAKDPNDRFGDAQQVAEALRDPSMMAAKPAPAIKASAQAPQARPKASQRRESSSSPASKPRPRQSMSEMMAEARRRVASEQGPATAGNAAATPDRPASPQRKGSAPRAAQPRKPASAVLTGATGALLAAALVYGLVYWMRSQDALVSAPAAEVQPAATAPAPLSLTAAERAERIAAERRACPVHVSQLSDGKLWLYEDVLMLPGARRIGGTDIVRMPPVQTADGRELIFDVSPNGCARVARQ